MNNHYTQVEFEEGPFVFSDKHVELFKSVGTILEWPKDYIISNAGEVMDSCCYYILSGQIVGYTISFSGEQIINTSNGPNSIGFLSSMFIKHKMNNHFKTASQTQVIKIPKREFYRLLERDSTLCISLLYTLSYLLVESKRQYRERGNYTVPWRVCKKLLVLAKECGTEYNGRIKIPVKISQQAIANSIQANRVTVCKTITGLKDLGLIETINGYYCILDLKAFIKHMDYIS